MPQLEARQAANRIANEEAAFGETQKRDVAAPVVVHKRPASAAHDQSLLVVAQRLAHARRADIAAAEQLAQDDSIRRAERVRVVDSGSLAGHVHVQARHHDGQLPSIGRLHRPAQTKGSGTGCSAHVVPAQREVAEHGVAGSSAHEDGAVPAHPFVLVVQHQPFVLHP